MKYLIFDSGPLINFSMNCLLPLLEKLKQKTQIEFLITKEIKREIIDHPLTIKRFQLGALRLEDLFKRKIIKYADISKHEVDELRRIREKLMQIANSTFRAGNKDLHLIDKGEAAALALSTILKQKTGEYAPLAVDERTTRMLCENPDKLKQLMEKKLHTSIITKKQNYLNFQNFKIIRSTEIAYVAYKKGLTELKGPHILEAILYGLKLKGCSITDGEIEEMKRL